MLRIVKFESFILHYLFISRRQNSKIEVSVVNIFNYLFKATVTKYTAPRFAKEVPNFELVARKVPCFEIHFPALPKS